MNDANTFDHEIAIIGMSGHFPGAQNIEEFWYNLREGVESISFFSDEELLTSHVNDAVLDHPNYVKASAVMENIGSFDASFFGFSPKEAELTDPQHRLFLECAWEALENAGYDAARYDGLIGVYAGASMNTYLLSNLYSSRDPANAMTDFQILLGNDKDFLSTRVSYKLDLKGPSVVVQTACSTSLVALHLACQSLLNGECDMALAGGVSLRVPQKAGYLYQEGGIASADGHCRAFDAKAQGTVPGNGAGIVVLKRLANALSDGDCIHAIIKGSAMNNDGSSKVGYTAPSIDGQAKVIAEALAMAGIGPETITYIEAHGTGTPLGDPIEIAALTQAFRSGTEAVGFCALGSVKTNIGHLDAAAGVAGLIKAVLALKHKSLPPSLHFKEPNPQINFANSPFYVNTVYSSWETQGTPRRAGVSSFGIGGTNVHAILEEAPATQAPAKRVPRPWQILVFSAKTSSGIKAMTANTITHLREHPELSLADVAYTLQIGRRAFSHRQMVVCHDLSDVVHTLNTMEPTRVFTAFQEVRDRPVVFTFPGQGTQYTNMARELYELEPVFREQVDQCIEVLKPHLGLDLRSVLYPSKEQIDEVTRQLNQTWLAQPALFVVEYALAKLWMTWGVLPRAMIGHSIGEYVAACLAGVLSLEDALELVAMRGLLMQNLSTGAMLAVPLTEKEVLPFLAKQLSLAAVNAPGQCVVSGSIEVVEALAQQLEKKGVHCRRLNISHAFHSEMMDPILGIFAQKVAEINLKPPQMRYLSNVTGTWITASQATDPNYWVSHLRATVRFAQGLQEAMKEPDCVLLEIGPGRVLSVLAKQNVEDPSLHLTLSSLPASHEKRSDIESMLISLGQLWLAGVTVDWHGLYTREECQRIPLPTYPFERQSYWIEPLQNGHNTASFNTERTNSEKKLDIADWFYVPLWKQVTLPPQIAPGNEQKSRWLVFSDICRMGTLLGKRIEEAGENVTIVVIGEHFTRLSEHLYAINPRDPDDYSTLLKELNITDAFPQKILHLWTVNHCDSCSLDDQCLGISQDFGFYSLLFLAQALGKQNMTHPLHIWVVSNNAHQVGGGEVLCPEKAMVLGPCKVIPQEYPNITCSYIDIVLPEAESWQEKRLVELLIDELKVNAEASIIAYRGNHRWLPSFEAMRIESKAKHAPRLREGGVYMITGGLGGIGFVLAEYLARYLRAKLILVGRSPFPERGEWSRWLATHDVQDQVSQKVQKVQMLEELGASVIVSCADVTNWHQMRRVIDQISRQFGVLHGVIHAAGVAGGGIIQLKTRDIAESVLAPKVKGALVLDALLKDTELDFLVFCSSLTSIFGGVGQVDYCSANAFLDALAHRNGSMNRAFTLSINWDTWQEVGMAFNTEVPRELRKQREEHLKQGILSQEGCDAFNRVLGGRLHQVLVSTRDLQAQFEQNNLLTAENLVEEAEEVNLFTHPRPDLAATYKSPRNEIEQTIADTLQKTLGIDRVGIYDDFLALGGDSLLALNLVSFLRKAFQLEIPMSSIFEASNVAKLAEFIEDMFIEKLEELSEDRAQGLTQI